MQSYFVAPTVEAAIIVEKFSVATFNLDNLQLRGLADEYADVFRTIARDRTGRRQQLTPLSGAAPDQPGFVGEYDSLYPVA
jgi:hypothetical protein